MICKIVGCFIGVLALPALACDYPDEGGMPLRRAVTRIEMLPEVDAWARAIQKNGITPQYLVRLDEPVRWRSYLITPDGKRILPTKQAP